MRRVLITDGVHPSIIKSVEKLGFQVTYLPKLAYEKLGPIIHDYDGIIINSKIIMNRSMIDQASKLHFIGRLGSGLDIIDLDYAAEKNIAVLSAPEGNCNAVGEHALGMLLSLANNLNRADREVRDFLWNREKNRGFELEGKKIGIVGYGHTGPAFAEKLEGFRCEVMIYDKYRTHIGLEKRYIYETSLSDIQEKCDIISFHLPLTDETHNLVDRHFLGQCKRKPVIVNTARGKIVDLNDLVTALEEGSVSGACLDVLENEKPSTYETAERELYARLFAMDNVVLSPHIAGWTKESKKKIASVLIEKISSHVGDRM